MRHLLPLALLFSLVGCDGSSPPDDGTGGTDAGPRTGSDGGGSMTAVFECCAQGAGYDCPSEAALTQCLGGFDPSCYDACMSPDCFMECDRRASMAGSPDPSACVPDSRVSCTPNPGGSCDPGDSCTLDSQCASDNCTLGRCYGNQDGCRCELDSDCTNDNCTGGVCYSNAVGSPCELDSDCTSENCTLGRCQDTVSGSPCELGSDCDSGTCTSGFCE